MSSQTEPLRTGEYTYLPIERVWFGQDSTRHLGEELDRFQSKKPFLVTGKTIHDQTDLVSRLESHAGRQFVGVYHGILQHAPLGRINKAVQEAKSAGADALISLGGGSPIDSTKIIVKELSADFTKPLLPHVAVPTTLSAAEFSHSAGMTLEEEKRKSGVRDPRMVPRIVILDPSLTLPTPKWLWASTGIRSLDHAVESILSQKRQPYSDTLALEAIRLIFGDLPISNDDSTNISARLSCQMAAWMSYAGAYSVGTGLSHAIGRVIGARYDIPHGITSCITLAEVMRLAAEKTPERLVPVAKAEGVTNINESRTREIALAAAAQVSILLQRLSLAKKLSDYDIPRTDLPRIAEEVSQGLRTSQKEALRVLENVY